MTFVAYMFLTVATAPGGVTIDPEFERYRACIREHRSEIRRPYAPRLGPLQADIRAINRYCGRLRPQAFGAYKRAFAAVQTNLKQREWLEGFDNLARGTLYEAEIR